MAAQITTCVLCNDDQPLDEFHIRTSEHIFNQLLDTFQKRVKSHRSSRNGIELKVEVQQRNGFVLDFSQTPDNKGNHILNITPEAFQRHNNKLDFLCTVKNGRTRRGDDILITSGGILHPFPHYSFKDPNGIVGQQRFVQLGAGESYQLIVSFELAETAVSNFKIPFYISFQTYSRTEAMKAFSICRAIIVSIHNNIAEDIVEIGKSPFTHNKWEDVSVIPATTNNFAAMRPDEFPIPKKYFRTMIYGLRRDFQDGILGELLHKLNPDHVTRENYCDFFHILLWLEETSCILGISCYNMEDVRLRCITSKVLELKVPGLAEKRPSVLKGDCIQLKVQGDHQAYEGIIRNVTDSTVEIDGVFKGLVDTVAEDPETNIDVRFMLRRIQFERMHQGVKQVVATGFVDNLFPHESLLNNPVHESITLAQTDLHNQQIYDNAEQITAVHKIINKTSRSVPYVVWGPPGTGKTVTIVEAIYQLKRLTKQKMLVCAPANAACNMLTEKLAKFCRPNELRRIMSESCDTTSVHKDILKYCNLVEIEKERDVIRVGIAELKEFRIVVTTLILAAKYTKEYHPDIIFVDEAAQAREPELCCAMGLLIKTKRLVLAGDPKQLGPTHRCWNA
ncbi:hypothetical protein HUJ04_006159 [Dendroctonus ponderosae]|nr:hypothetical protein HUJ04_006159 [Dendroctonus ponderosae]